MNFKKTSPQIRDHEDRILPLINVVFLLLIFFMIAGALTPTDPFELEAPVSISDSPVQRDDFQIFISSEGDFALNRQVLEQEQVIDQIAYAVKRDNIGLIEVKSDRKTEGNLIIGFMNKLKELGVERVNLITEQEL